MSSKVERSLHALFETGVVLKGINGIWEIALGVSALFFNKAMLGWLSGQSTGFFGRLAHFFEHASSSTLYFAALYILGHGILNIFLAVQLFRNRLWAYPFAITALSLFVTYQIYRISAHHSPTLLALTGLDIVFIALTLHEYRHQKKLAK